MTRLTQLHIPILFVLIAACGASEEDGSSVQGDVAWDLYDGLVSESRPEGKARALANRLTLLKELAKGGGDVDQYTCPNGPQNPCGVINVVIEFGAAGTSEVGHTAISLMKNDGRSKRNAFYDFGPGTKTTADGRSWSVGSPGVYSLPRAPIGAPFVRQPGTQWWDNQHVHDGAHPRDIDFENVLSKLDELAGDLDVLRIPICVAQEMVDLVEKYWEKVYAEMPMYSVPGNQCTSLVTDSYEDAFKAIKDASRGKLNLRRYTPDIGFINRSFESPEAFAKRIQSDDRYLHQCGSLKGKVPRAVMLNHSSLYDSSATLNRFID